MDINSLSYRTLKNINYSLVGFISPIVFTIFVTPVLLRHLGLTDYGVYILVITIGAFLGYLDLGLTSSVAKYTADYSARRAFGQLQKMVGSAVSLYVIIGLAGFAIFIFLGSVSSFVFHIAHVNAPHVFVIFALSGVVFFLNSLSTFYASISQAMQRFDITTKLNFFQLSLVSLSSLALVLFGFRLKAILAATIVVDVVIFFIYRRWVHKLLPEVSLRFAWVKEEIVRLYKFGFLAFVAGVSTTALYSLDRLIIPVFLGPAVLTYYSLPGNVAQKTAGVSGSIAVVFFPMSSSLFAQNNLETIRAVYRRSMRNILVLASALTMASIAFAYQLLFFWVGGDVAGKGWKILIILAFTNFFIAIYSPLSMYLMGMGKIKFLSLWASGLALLNIVLLVVLLPLVGLIGAAWAYLFSVLPIAVMLIWSERKYFSLRDQWSFYWNFFWKTGLVSAIYFLIAKWYIVPLVKTLPMLLLLGPLSVAGFFILYYLFGFFDKEDVLLIKRYLKHVRSKILSLFPINLQ
jgi:O-antigen/teichoic acid export membrane protein